MADDDYYFSGGSQVSSDPWGGSVPGMTAENFSEPSSNKQQDDYFISPGSGGGGGGSGVGNDDTLDRMRADADARYKSLMGGSYRSNSSVGGMGGAGISGGGSNLSYLSSSLQKAIASDNAAREDARKRALADRAQAIEGQKDATQNALGAAGNWKAGVDYLSANPDVISGAVKNYLLGRVFDRIDLDTASSENLLAQRYAQSGRAINPAVMQYTRDKAMMEKANQSREVEISAASMNRQSEEQATAAAGEYGRYAGGLYTNEANQIGQYLQNTHYDTPQTATLLASLASRLM